MPLFRSSALVRLLAYLFTTDDRPQTLSELSRRLHVTPSTIQRDVDQLEEAGIVRTRRLGTARLVELNEESTYLPDLRNLFMKAFGPREVLSQLLGEIKGIEEAFIFGSWAERYSGKQGPPPEDLDVLVVGAPDPHSLYRVLDEATERTGLRIEPTLATPEEWHAGTSAFFRTLRERALIPLDAVGDSALPPPSRRRRNTRYVLPDPDNGWVVTKEGRRRASAHTRTKGEAVRRAREIVRNAGGGEVRIAGRDGRIIQVDSVEGA